jgi:hypothetical protein
MAIKNDYAALHSRNPGFGQTGLRLMGYIRPLIDDCSASLILDFGCGKGALGKKLATQGFDVRLFDPYVPDYAEVPEEKFDLVLCTDVMEHIPIEDLDNIIKNISEYSSRVVFVVSLTFADMLLSDGTNAHCTIRSEDWWRERLGRHFSVIDKVPTRQDTAVCFVTWMVKSKTKRKLRFLRKGNNFQQVLKSFILWPIRITAAFWLQRLGRSNLKELVLGKTVAIVGNAQSLSDSSYGSAIDEHDLVIRINRSPILAPSISGRRTSIIASSMWVSSGLFDGRNCQLFMWMTPKRKAFPLWLLNPKRQVFVFSSTSYRRLGRLVGSRPSTGLMTIEALLESQPAVVTLFGFDGFASKSLSGNRGAESVGHDFEKELQHLMMLSDKLPWLQHAARKIKRD